MLKSRLKVFSFIASALFSGLTHAAATDYAGAYVKLNVNNSYLCAGALVSSDVVITAEHCLTEPSSVTSISVSYGSAFSSSQEAASTVENTGWVRIPGIDVALIKLQRPVSSSGTQTLKLPQKCPSPKISDFANDPVVVYRQTPQSLIVAGALQLFGAAMLPQSEYVTTPITFNSVGPNSLLAGTYWAVRTVWFYGDSGGPLVDSNGILVGTVSNGGLPLEYAAATCTVSDYIQAGITAFDGNASSDPATSTTRAASGTTTQSPFGSAPQSTSGTTQSSSSALASIIEALANTFSSLWSGS
ncbi:trypsin-like serine protease [Caballeronia sp. LZ033]|uniref:trypsin-like serine protease n=1 Tax=Caballeronia sp. LZ033 TaxID=3038566 RepID=UPI002861BFEC|nr:trypsin-like serine protease [Caballeronia sp. LZ033]MDR5814824.1 trypsin-like serine protease [Caballeronia sp. LZ033]